MLKIMLSRTVPCVFPIVQANEYGITPVDGSAAFTAASGNLRGDRRIILSPAKKIFKISINGFKFCQNKIPKNVTQPSTGAGTGADAQAEAEWEETQNKARAIVLAVEVVQKSLFLDVGD